MNITREQAEAVATVVRAQFAEYFKPMELDSGTVLSATSQPEDVTVFEGERDTWIVSWEDGPSEWAYGFGAEPYVAEEFIPQLVSEFGATPEQARKAMTSPRAATLPEGIEVEPYYSFSLVVSEA